MEVAAEFPVHHGGRLLRYLQEVRYAVKWQNVRHLRHVTIPIPGFSGC